MITAQPVPSLKIRPVDEMIFLKAPIVIIALIISVISSGIIIVILITTICIQKSFRRPALAPRPENTVPVPQPNWIENQNYEPPIIHQTVEISSIV